MPHNCNSPFFQYGWGPFLHEKNLKKQKTGRIAERFYGPYIIYLYNVNILWKQWKNMNYPGDVLGSKVHRYFSSCSFWFSCLFLFCFSFKQCISFQHENLKGSSYSATEHHTVNLMIASRTPLDFITGFNERRTTAVWLSSWFIQYRFQPPVLIRQRGFPSISPTFHFPLSISLSLPASHFLIFTTQWFK